MVKAANSQGRSMKRNPFLKPSQIVEMGRKFNLDEANIYAIIDAAWEAPVIARGMDAGVNHVTLAELELCDRAANKLWPDGEIKPLQRDFKASGDGWSVRRFYEKKRTE